MSASRSKSPLLITGLVFSGVLNLALVSIGAWMYGTGSFDPPSDREQELWSQLGSVEAQHAHQIEALKSSHANEIDEIASRHEKEITKLESEYSTTQTRVETANSSIQADSELHANDQLYDSSSGGSAIETIAAIPLRYPSRVEFDHGYGITTEYDEFDDKTSMALKFEREIKDLRAGEASNLEWCDLRIISYYDGKVRQDHPLLVTLMFTVKHDYGWKYLECNRMTFLSEGKRYAPSVVWDGDAKTSLEFLITSMPIAEFLAMIDVDQIRGKICNDEFEFSSQQVEAMIDFASRLAPLE